MTFSKPTCLSLDEHKSQKCCFRRNGSLSSFSSQHRSIARTVYAAMKVPLRWNVGCAVYTLMNTFALIVCQEGRTVALIPAIYSAVTVVAAVGGINECQ